MTPESHDPRDIPMLTEAIEQPAKTHRVAIRFQRRAAAILTETLKLADSLLHQAAKDIEATLFEHVFDRLRAELPELVDRALREHAAVADEPQKRRLSEAASCPAARAHRAR